MMKEYKRCKYCNLEMLKNEIKCPHCGRIQTIFYIPKNDNHSINHTNKRASKSYSQKNNKTYTNTKINFPNMSTSNSKSKFTKFIPILIILFILAGIFAGIVNTAIHSIIGTDISNIGSFIENFIPEDMSYEDEPLYEDAIECDVYQILYKLEDDYTLAREAYEYQYVMLHGTINDVIVDEYGESFYKVSLDDSKYQILIPIYDYYDNGFEDEYKYDNIGFEFTYYGEVSFDDIQDEIIYIQNGHFK